MGGAEHGDERRAAVAPASDVERQLVSTASPDALRVAMVLALVAGPSALAFVAMPWTLVLAGALALVTALAWARRELALVHLGVVATVLVGLVAVPGVLPTWPIPLVLAIAVDVVLARMHPRLRARPPWWRRGSVDRTTVVLAIGFVLLASVALLLWQRWTSPDLGDLVTRIPKEVPWPALVAGALAFSVVNAFAEEIAWRGAMYDALARCFGRAAPAVVLQAVSFGLAHFQGFPRGWIGVGLAAIYGLMMGEIRRRSGGLLAPIVAHVFADATIVAILVAVA